MTDEHKQYRRVGPWQGEERRGTPQFSLREIHEHIDRHIESRFDQLSNSMMRQTETQYSALSDLIKSGFPNGDPVEHRKAHEQMMRYVEKRERFISDLSMHLAKGGVWALAVFMGVSMWHFFVGKVTGSE